MTCPKCGAKLAPELYGAMTMYVCSNKRCDYATTQAPSGPGRPAKEYEPSESEKLEKLVVARIITALEREGYEILQVGQRKAQGSGTTEGCPDLFIRHPSWPVAVWKGLEVKPSAKARRRPKQVELGERGGLIFVWTSEMALDEARAFEEHLK